LAFMMHNPARVILSGANISLRSSEMKRSRTAQQHLSKSGLTAFRKVGSTGDERVPRRSSKRCKRFDFQKSAIYCRFLKVRLRKHPHGMFSPLRMTQGVLRFSHLFRSPIGLLFYVFLRQRLFQSLSDCLQELQGIDRGHLRTGHDKADQVLGHNAVVQGLQASSL